MTISIVMLALNSQQMLCVWHVLLKRKVVTLMEISKNSVKIVLKMYVPISKMISLRSSMVEILSLMIVTLNAAPPTILILFSAKPVN